MVGVKREHVNDAKLDLCLNFMHKVYDETQSLKTIFCPCKVLEKSLNLVCLKLYEPWLSYQSLNPCTNASINPKHFI